MKYDEFLTRVQQRGGPDDREHAVTVVCHLLHAECEQWSWTTHQAEAHRREAVRIVGALTREGWAPHSAA